MYYPVVYPNIITYMTYVRSTPLLYVYIHGQLHRSVTDSVNHIQLPLMAVTWVTKILINVFRQSRCQTRVKVFLIFYNDDDRNDRNDKESEKSYVSAIARGLWISCHSCHLCHWEDANKPSSAALQVNPPPYHWQGIVMILVSLILQLCSNSSCHCN